jgi:hypothetical protein
MTARDMPEMMRLRRGKCSAFRCGSRRHFGDEQPALGDLPVQLSFSGG